MVLLAEMRNLDLSILRDSLEKVFKVRKTHSLPFELEAPPIDWQRPYSELATDCAISTDLNEAFGKVMNIYKEMIH